MAVDAGTEPEVSGDGSGRDTFTQAGGLVGVEGRMIIENGLFHLTGGGVWGTSPSARAKFAWGLGDTARRRSASSAAAPCWTTPARHALGAGGSPVGFGDATLTAAPDATNAGAIVLQSLDGVHNGYFRVPQGAFTNEPGGMIQVQLPPDDSGQGSITAGVLSDDGGMGDTTGLPTLPQYQAALTQVQAATANGGGGGDGGGSGGDGGGGSNLGGLLDPQTWM